MALPTPSHSARALVTGASQGIGLAIARDLARYGHNLILVARRGEVLQEIADELESRHGVIVEVRAVDLADREQRAELIAKLEKEMKERGFLNLYACIAYPEVEDEYLTKNSARFHEHLGYELVGKFHKCGYKFGRWYHMIWMEKIIGEHTGVI